MNACIFSRRQCLQHIGGIALTSLALDRSSAWAAKEHAPRVLFVSRAGAYEPEIVRRQPGELNASERILVALGRRNGIDVECHNDCGAFDSDLSHYDAFVLFWNFDPTQPNARGETPISARGKERLMAAVAGGKGLVGIHCAAYAFLSGKQEEWQPAEQRDPYTKMLGGELCGCLAKQTCRYRIVAPEFPGVAALPTPMLTLADEPYGLKNFATDLHVIAVLETDGLDMQQRKDKTFPRPPFPCVWARRHEQGRVFYLSMGHDEDSWQTEPFQNMVQGGLNWVLRRIDADLTPNLTAVAPGAEKINSVNQVPLQ